MKYQEELDRKIIKVWEDFYIDYGVMMNILKPAREAYKKHRDKKLEEEIKTMELADLSDDKGVDDTPLLSKEDKEEIPYELTSDLIKASENFYQQFRLEINKINYFYNENIEKVIKHKINEVKEQIKHARKIRHFKMYNETFELALKEIYKDICLTKDFYEVNMSIKVKLFEKYNRYFYQSEVGNKNSEVNSSLVDIETQINNFIDNQTKLPLNTTILEGLRTEVLALFQKYYSFKYKGHCDKILKNYLISNELTESQSFTLGLFVGLLIFQTAIILILGYYHKIDMDNDIEFKMIFPMFRGFFVICLYWWMHGLAVYVWIQANISYRVIFGIDNKFSSPIEIFRRASIFTFILLSCVLVYMIKRIWSGAFFAILLPVPLNSLPLICWGSLILFLFCPFEIWDHDGRSYLGNLAKESCISFLARTEFKHDYFMCQITSFIATLRDIEYTACYYSYYDAPLWAKLSYCEETHRVYLFIAFLPNFISILQVLKEMFDNRELFPKILSAANYSLSILVAYFSFLLPEYPNLLSLWLITTFISSGASFAWDVIIDFGFFEKGKNFPLRSKLYYENKIIYYAIMILDFWLRFLWLVTLSPEVIGYLFRPETAELTLLALEVFRRGLWNLIKVEYKHIDISQEYKVSNDVEMPFIKRGGKYVNNESNLLSVMKLNREDKIKIEMQKVLQESGKKKVLYQSRCFNDLKERKIKVNNDFVTYLNSYKVETMANIGNKIGRILSRKI